MATKNNPGEFDCYANAKPDEPMFVLLGRDAKAPGTVRYWCEKYEVQCRVEATGRNDHRAGQFGREFMSNEQARKYREALNVADAMEEWRARRGPFEGQESITYHQLENAVADHMGTAGLARSAESESVQKIARAIWNYARVVK